MGLLNLMLLGIQNRLHYEKDCTRSPISHLFLPNRKGNLKKIDLNGGFMYGHKADIYWKFKFKILFSKYEKQLKMH